MQQVQLHQFSLPCKKSLLNRLAVLLVRRQLQLDLLLLPQQLQTLQPAADQGRCSIPYFDQFLHHRCQPSNRHRHWVP
jgi:hypothetical protein